MKPGHVAVVLVALCVVLPLGSLGVGVWWVASKTDRPAGAVVQIFWNKATGRCSAAADLERICTAWQKPGDARFMLRDQLCNNEILQI
jgi:hypothetical protein